MSAGSLRPSVTERVQSGPGCSFPADDPAALAAALRTWLGDAEVRLSWRRAARERRASLAGWSTTTSVLAVVLAEAAR